MSKQIILVLVLALLLTATAVAQETTEFIDYVVNDAQINFPQDVHFRLELPADSGIKTAVLAYDVDKVSCLDAVAQVPVELTATEAGLVADWTWVMGRSGNPPPGAELSWSWRLTDAAGKTTSTPIQTIPFTDGRFEWQIVEADGIQLHWYRGAEVGPLLLDAAEAGLATLENDMGIQLQDDVDIYIYGSAADMRDAMLFVQDWAGGVAFDEYNTILMGVEPSSAEGWGRSTMRHELAHLVVGQYGRSCVGGARPTWLNEGLAMYAEGEQESDTLASLRVATQNNSFEPLRSLNGSFSSHGSEAGIAYAQSYSVVDFLLAEYGQEAMQTLLLTLADGVGYDDALTQVYGVNVDGLESAWRESLGLSQRPFPPTPTPIIGANVPTAIPLGKPANVPTPPSAAEMPDNVEERPLSPNNSGICGLGMIPLLLFGFVFMQNGRIAGRKNNESKQK